MQIEEQRLSTSGLVQIRLVTNPKVWMESQATDQLKAAAALSGMIKAVGFPDLHPGKGIPVGAAFVTKDIFYPHLIGNDIGCGIGLWQLDLKAHKLDLDKLEKRLSREDACPPCDGSSISENLQINTSTRQFGTIGKGNHFAEIQVVEEILDVPTAEKLGLNKKLALLAVHSGSRDIGEHFYQELVAGKENQGFLPGSEEGQAYLLAHNKANLFAKANREQIARSLAETIGAELQACLSETSHNLLEAKDETFIHRKGASQSDQGAIVIAGTRGTFSYLVVPTGNQAENAYSLAHGAGRKWGRQGAQARMEDKHRRSDLSRTDLQSRVICDDANLLFQEAPEAYKNIEHVIAAMEDAGLLKVVAKLRPKITYKR